MDGDVFVYTASDEAPRLADGDSRPKDKRDMINTHEELLKFCANKLQKPLERFLEEWENHE